MIQTYDARKLKHKFSGALRDVPW